MSSRTCRPGLSTTASATPSKLRLPVPGGPGMDSSARGSSGQPRSRSGPRCDAPGRYAVSPPPRERRPPRRPCRGRCNRQVAPTATDRCRQISRTRSASSSRTTVIAPRGVRITYWSKTVPSGSSTVATLSRRRGLSSTRRSPRTFQRVRSSPWARLRGYRAGQATGPPPQRRPRRVWRFLRAGVLGLVPIVIETADPAATVVARWDSGRDHLSPRSSACRRTVSPRFRTPPRQGRRCR